MVNAAVTSDTREAERALALSYALPDTRAALSALFALDERLSAIVRSTRDPMVGQMRLTWWYEALVALDTAAPPAEPVLRALHDRVVPNGTQGAVLAEMVDGWELLLDPDPLDAKTMSAYAALRGGVLFAATARACGVEEEQSRLGGEGWALADLATHLRDPDEAARARDMAADRIAAAFGSRWPRATRPLGALALIARFDVMPSAPPPAGPRRVLRLMRHRWNGT